MEEKKNTHIWSWIAFGFFALLALAYLPHFAGFTAVAVAIFVFPLTKWQSLLERVLPKRVRIAMLALLALLSVFTAPAVENEAPTLPAESSAWSAEASQSVLEESTSQASEHALQETSTPTSEAPTQEISEDTTEPSTEEPTEATAQATTTPTTEPPTQETSASTTEPPTEATTQATTTPVTEPPTQETSAPTTEASTEEATVPPTTQAETTQPSVSDERSYVVNTNTGKFHYPSCSSVKDIKDENRWDYFGTRETLTDMGYVACKRCKP